MEGEGQVGWRWYHLWRWLRQGWSRACLCVLVLSWVTREVFACKLSCPSAIICQVVSIDGVCVLLCILHIRMVAHAFLLYNVCACPCSLACEMSLLEFFMLFVPFAWQWVWRSCVCVCAMIIPNSLKKEEPEIRWVCRRRLQQANNHIQHPKASFCKRTRTRARKSTLHTMRNHMCRQASIHTRQFPPTTKMRRRVYSLLLHSRQYEQAQTGEYLHTQTSRPTEKAREKQRQTHGKHSNA